MLIYAGFWARFFAYLIDTIVLLIGGFMLNFVVRLLGLEDVGGLIGMAIAWLYGAVLESSRLQATLGKAAMGLMVTDEYGRRISFQRAVGRQFAKILSGLTCGIGYLLIAFTPRKQALHDFVARTLVVARGYGV